MSDVTIDVMRFITHLGDAVFLAVISICFLGVLIFKKHYKVGFYWTVTIAFSHILCAWLKVLIGKDRPDDVYHLIQTSSAAFPSGHALKSTVVYIGIYILVLRLFSLSSAHKNGMKLLIVLPFAIGISRILLGVHWPSDILAGWFIGFAMTFMFMGKRTELRPSLTKGI